MFFSAGVTVQMVRSHKCYGGCHGISAKRVSKAPLRPSEGGLQNKQTATCQSNLTKSFSTLHAARAVPHVGLWEGSSYEPWREKMASKYRKSTFLLHHLKSIERFPTIHLWQECRHQTQDQIFICIKQRLHLFSCFQESSPNKQMTTWVIHHLVLGKLHVANTRCGKFNTCPADLSRDWRSSWWGPLPPPPQHPKSANTENLLEPSGLGHSQWNATMAELPKCSCSSRTIHKKNQVRSSKQKSSLAQAKTPPGYYL